MNPTGLPLVVRAKIWKTDTLSDLLTLAVFFQRQHHSSLWPLEVTGSVKHYQALTVWSA